MPTKKKKIRQGKRFLTDTQRKELNKQASLRAIELKSVSENELSGYDLAVKQRSQRIQARADERAHRADERAQRVQAREARAAARSK